MLTQIIARKKDGLMIKGTTGDFRPQRNAFHVTLAASPGASVEVLMTDLKAVFFVKALEGSKTPHNRPPDRTKIVKQALEKHISVQFFDDEVIEGFTIGFQLDRLGFFMRPLDPSDNNERIFVVVSALKGIVLDGQTIDLISVEQTERFCEFCGRKLDLGWKYCPYDGAKVK